MSPFWLFFIVLRIIMGVASMVINLLTLVCVITKSYLRSAASFLIASLAVSDFLHGVLTSIVKPIRYFSTSWNYTHPACLVGLCIEVTIVIGQFCTFAMLAFERCNSLLSQLNHSKKWSKKTVVMIMVLTWLVIAVYHIAVTIYIADIPEGTGCSIIRYYPPFFLYTGIAIFFTTTILILAGYGHIAWIAYKSRNQVNPAQSTTQQRNHRKDMKITKMMALVVGIFFMLWLPFAVTLVTTSHASPDWQWYLFGVSILIYDVNFWINPFIYAWRDKGFKKAFGEMLSACRRTCCCCLPIPPPGGSGSSTSSQPPTQPTMAVIQVSPAVGPGRTPGNAVPRLVARDPINNVKQY